MIFKVGERNIGKKTGRKLPEFSMLHFNFLNENYVIAFLDKFIKRL